MQSPLEYGMQDMAMALQDGSLWEDQLKLEHACAGPSSGHITSSLSAMHLQHLQQQQQQQQLQQLQQSPEHEHKLIAVQAATVAPPTQSTFLPNSRLLPSNLPAIGSFMPQAHMLPDLPPQPSLTPLPSSPGFMHGLPIDNHPTVSSPNDLHDPHFGPDLDSHFDNFMLQGLSSLASGELHIPDDESTLWSEIFNSTEH
jgi:hypothetical protein